MKFFNLVDQIICEEQISKQERIQGLKNLAKMTKPVKISYGYSIEDREVIYDPPHVPHLWNRGIDVSFDVGMDVMKDWVWSREYENTTSDWVELSYRLRQLREKANNEAEVIWGWKIWNTSWTAYLGVHYMPKS